MPMIGVPKNSATMAPISAQRRVDLQAVEDERQRGRKPQARQRAPVRTRRTAHQIAVARPAVAQVRRQQVFTSIGKKVITTTTATLECSRSRTTSP
jgi:hypothetical protein